MKKWLWLLLLPSLAVAQRPASINMRKDPVYISVTPQDIVLYPDGRSFPPRDFDMPKNDFIRLLDDIEKVGRVRYIVLLLSPDSSRLQRRLRALIDQREIDLGLEPWDPGTKIDTTKINKHFIPLVPESTLYISTRPEHRLWHEWSAQRGNCEVRVYSNSVVFLTNNLALSWEELQIPGNPFDQMLDRWESGDYFPSVFCKESGSDDMYAWIMDRIYDRGAKMNEWTAAGTPIEVPATGRAPFFLECRGNRLFTVAADTSATEFEISGLKDLDPAAQYVCFLVRPDGFEIFRQARKAAWEHGLDVSCELQDKSGPFAIGPEGTPLLSSTPEPPAPIISQKTQDLLARADAWMSKAETCSARPFISSNKSPVYVEVQPEQIVIHPEKTEIAAAGIEAPGGEFERFLAQFEAQRDTRYIVLLLSPGTAVLQRKLRQQIRAHGIKVGFGPIDELQALSPEGSPAQKLPAYWECRQNQLFPISLAEIQAACDAKTEELRKRSGSDETDFLRQAAQTTVEWNGQSIDFTYALLGQYVLSPSPEAQGVPLGNQMDALDPDMHRLHLFVRPNGLDISSQIRTLAQERNIEVEVQLLDEKEFIRLGHTRPGCRQ